jgi:hypothetical protein
MVHRFAGRYVRPSTADKTRLNFSDFEFAEADRALFIAAHMRNIIFTERRGQKAQVNPHGSSAVWLGAGVML